MTRAFRQHHTPARDEKWRGVTGVTGCVRCVIICGGASSFADSRGAMLSGQPFRLACQILLLATSLIALVTCPHSKVEESFNLQAAHDLYYVGVLPAVKSFNNVDSASCSEVGVQTCTATEKLPYDHAKYPGGKQRVSVRWLSVSGTFIFRAHESDAFHSQLCQEHSLGPLSSPQWLVSSR